jgi:hypothetical protein
MPRFQQAVTRVSGIDIPWDGDLVAYGTRKIGRPRSRCARMSAQLQMDDKQIHRDLLKGGARISNARRCGSALRTRRPPGQHAGATRAPAVDQAGESEDHRKLTTAWFAERVGNALPPLHGARREEPEGQTKTSDSGTHWGNP